MNLPGRTIHIIKQWSLCWAHERAVQKMAEPGGSLWRVK